MDSVRGVLSKLKRGLDSIVDEYKKSVSDIEKEEEFIQVLGDVVNYSKSDCLLLPFYDETILSGVIEIKFYIFDHSNNNIYNYNSDIIFAF